MICKKSKISRQLSNIFRHSALRPILSALVILVHLYPLTVLSSKVTVPNLKESRCLSLLKNEINELNMVLADEQEDTTEPLYELRGAVDGGDIAFEKSLPNWSSYNINLEETSTPEGDLRFPIAILGSELAHALGVRITYEIRNNQKHTILRFPGLKKLKALILQINVHLKEAGHEPIAYELVESDLLKSVDLMRLTINVEGDFEVAFPFSDRNTKLSAHEYSFHLSGIMFPLKLLQRVGAIDKLTYQLTQRLSSYSVMSGLNGQALKKQLIQGRMMELDFGLGELGAYIAKSVIDDKGYLKDKELRIKYAAHPDMTPAKAVVFHVMKLTNMSEKKEKYGFENFIVAGKDPSLIDENRDKVSFQLSAEESTALEKILDEFLMENKTFDDLNFYPKVSPVDWAEEMDLDLPVRQGQILRAILKIQQA